MRLATIKEQAPELEPAFKRVGKLLTAKGIEQERDKANVFVALDHSSSTETGNNRLYSGTQYNGVSQMRHVSDLAFVGGLFFDNDGGIPGGIFDTEMYPFGKITVQNYPHFLDKHEEYNFGGTSYMCVLRWIIEEAGFGNVDLTPERSTFGRKKLRVKATAEYPTYVAIATDGEPVHDNKDEIFELLTLMSQLPIFVQFIGVGDHDFELLRRLDTIDGRLIDNCGFFDAKEYPTQDGFLEQMLGEFASSFYPEARRLKMVTS